MERVKNITIKYQSEVKTRHLHATTTR